MAAARAWVVLAACILVGLLNEISGSILTLALPTVAHELAAPPELALVILLAAKLAMGALLLAGGGLGDRLGRKRVLLAGILLVALASAGAMAARSAGMLAGARLLDGIGNALIGPLALAISVAAFPEAMRARIIGLFLGISGLGVALGPLAAGFLVQWGGWRVGFAAPLALALAGGAALAIFAAGEAPERRRHSSDPVGMALCAVGLAALVLGFVRAGHGGWLDGGTLALLAGGGGCLAVFARWETSWARTPLLDPLLLRSRPVLAAMAAMALAAMAVNGTMVPLLYFLQRIQGHAPVAAVLHLLPLVAAAAILAPRAGALAERHGHRGVVACGLAAMAAGNGIMAALSPGMGYGPIFLALLLIGGGSVAVLAPAADLIMATSGNERSGSAAALTSALLQVGGAVGIALLTPVFVQEAAREFFVRLAARGYAREEVAGPARQLRDILRETGLDRVPAVPGIPSGLERDMLEAYVQAFTAGVAYVFLLAAALMLLALPAVLLGMSRPRA